MAGQIINKLRGSFMLSQNHKLFVLNFPLIVTLLGGLVGIRSAQAASSVVFDWAKRIGGTSYDHGSSLAVDGNGNVYATGNFSGTVDFDPSANTYNLTSAGDTDIFINKLNKDGNLVWAKRIGGVLSDAGHEVVLDGSGNTYSIGGFYGTVDFNPGTGINNLSSAGSSDIYISKLDANGNLVWAKGLGGVDYDYGNSLAVDGSGNVYVTGYFSKTADFDPSAGFYNLNSAGDYDIFIAKYDHAGNLVWAKNIGGSFADHGTSLTVDGSGNVYFIGEFWGTVDFDPGAGVYNLNSNGYLDIFISKFDSNGDFVWAKNMGGTETDSGADIDIDDSGYIYSTGGFNGIADFDPGANVYNLTSNGYWDFFISKLDNDGNLVWAKGLGGTLSDNSYGIELDSSGVYTVGGFVSNTVDFDPSAGTFNLNNLGNGDIFISKLDVNGEFVWAKSMGGPVYDYGLGIAVDEYHNVYSVGNFTNTVDFDPGTNTYNLTSAGYNDIFISKFLSISQVQLDANGTNDGWIGESSENSGMGGTMNSVATTFNLGDDAANKQYRAILSFNTSTLPDDAIVSKVVLKVKKNGVTGGGNPVNIFQGFMVDIKKGVFGTAVLELSDFNASASKTIGPLNPTLSISGWYSINLTGGKAYFNKTGNTQLRLRFSLDDNNNNVANFLRLYSGNATVTDCPQLVIQYYVP
jgi:hypothetical protein